MRRYISLLLFIGLAFWGCEKEKSVDFESLTLNNSAHDDTGSLVYHPNSQEPFTGKANIYYQDGKIEYEGEYLQGKVVKRTFLNRDGTKKLPINYKETLFYRDGVFYTKDTNLPYTGNIFFIFDDGVKRDEGIILFGKKHGKWVSWHPNGKKLSESFFYTGTQRWKYVEFYDDGKNKYEGYYNEFGIAKREWVYFEKDSTKYEGTLFGTISGFSKISGTSGGYFTSHSDTHMVVKEHGYTAGITGPEDGTNVGEYTKWYRNGEKEIEGIFSRMSMVDNPDTVFSTKTGKWIYYYDNGNKKLEGERMDARIYVNNPSEGVKNGEWIHYDYYGNKQKKEIYEIGELIDEKYY